VVDGGDPAEGVPDGISIADVPDEQLDLGREVGRAPALRAVHLRTEDVQDADVVAVGEELVGQMGSDEPCATRDEDVFGHVRLPLLRRLESNRAESNRSNRMRTA